MTSRIPLTQAELIAQLREQVGFLRASAAAYDSGEEAEAKRLAVQLRVLLDGQGSWPSLLTQLGVLHTLQFVNTAVPLPPNETKDLPDGSRTITSTIGSSLTRWQWTVGDDKWTRAAPLGDPSRRQPPLGFDDWWAGGQVSFGGVERLSRREIVRQVANADGGAHVDPGLRADYYAVSRAGALGRSLDGNGQALPADNAVLAMVRQIAYEVDETLAAQLPAGWLPSGP